jgi:3-oxoacyl-[acyl-carrier-protein] synthase II
MATDVLVCSVECCVIREIIEGFRALRVLVDSGDPLNVCRPFQEGSRGFFLGDAAVALLMSETGHTPYASVLGGAYNHDAFHLTAIESQGQQLEACLREGLDHAGISPSDVECVNAHGTGTKVNDSVEFAVVDRALPASAAIYSTKALTGHCMAASATLELTVSALSCERRSIPAAPLVAAAPTRVIDGPSQMTGGRTLNVAIGLGGYNSVVVMEPL